VAGLVALAVGFSITALAANTEQNRNLASRIESTDLPGGIPLSQFFPEWYEATSWLFLDSHQISVSVTVGDAFSSVEWIGTYTQTFLPTASRLQVVPPLLLSCAGFLVARRRHRTGPRDAVGAGATVVAGYLPGLLPVLAVASFEVVVPLFDIQFLEVTFDYTRAVLLAGVVYPVVFGGLGGLLSLVVPRGVLVSRLRDPTLQND
jgi:hypothetical protein